MSSSDDSRQSRSDVLRDLVELRRPVGASVSALRNFGWDSPEELVTLTTKDALRLLGRYRTGRLNGDEFVRWAEALEARDDVGLEEQHSDLLKDFLFELSTPELFEPMSDEVARRWEERIRESLS